MSIFTEWIPGWARDRGERWHDDDFSLMLNVEHDPEFFNVLLNAFHTACSELDRLQSMKQSARINHIKNAVTGIGDLINFTIHGNTESRELTLAELFAFEARADDAWQKDWPPSGSEKDKMIDIWISKLLERVAEKKMKEERATGSSNSAAHSNAATPTGPQVHSTSAATLSQFAHPPPLFETPSDILYDLAAKDPTLSLARKVIVIHFDEIQPGLTQRVVDMIRDPSTQDDRVGISSLEFPKFMRALESILRFERSKHTLKCLRSGDGLFDDRRWRAAIRRQHDAGYKFIALAVQTRQPGAQDEVEYASTDSRNDKDEMIEKLRAEVQAANRLRDEMTARFEQLQVQPESSARERADGNLAGLPSRSDETMVDVDSEQDNLRDTVAIPDVLDKFWWWGGGQPIRGDIPERPDCPRVRKGAIPEVEFDQMDDATRRSVEQLWLKSATQYWAKHFPRMRIPDLETIIRDVPKMVAASAISFEEVLGKAGVQMKSAKVNPHFSHTGINKPQPEKSDNYAEMATIGGGTDDLELYDVMVPKDGDQFTPRIWKKACQFFDFDHRCQFPRAELKIPGLKYGLYSYQFYAVFWLIFQAGTTALTGFFLADSTGFGKSVIMAAIAVVTRFLVKAWWHWNSYLNKCKKNKKPPLMHNEANGTATECPFDTNCQTVNSHQTGSRYRFFFQCPCVQTSLTRKILTRRHIGPIIYVVPPSLFFNTVDEIYKHVDFDASGEDNPNLTVLLGYNVTSKVGMYRDWKGSNPTNRHVDHIWDDIMCDRGDDCFLRAKSKGSRFIIVTSPNNLDSKVHFFFKECGFPVDKKDTLKNLDAVDYHAGFVPSWFFLDEWHQVHGEESRLLSKTIQKFERGQILGVSATPFTRSPKDLKGMYGVFAKLRTPPRIIEMEVENDEDSSSDDSVKEVEREVARGKDGELIREDVSKMTRGDAQNLMAEWLRISSDAIALAVDPTPDSLDKAADQIELLNKVKAESGSWTVEEQLSYDQAMTVIQEACAKLVIRRTAETLWFGQVAVPIPPHRHIDVRLHMPTDATVRNALVKLTKDTIHFIRGRIQIRQDKWDKEQAAYKKGDRKTEPDGKRPDLNEAGRISWLRQMDEAEIFSIFPLLAVFKKNKFLQCIKEADENRKIKKDAELGLDFSAAIGEQIHEEGTKHEIWKHHKKIFDTSPKLQALKATLAHMRTQDDCYGNPEKAIIFTRHRFADELLNLFLKDWGYKVGHVHAGMSPQSGDRQKVVQRFNEEEGDMGTTAGGQEAGNASWWDYARDKRKLDDPSEDLERVSSKIEAKRTGKLVKSKNEKGPHVLLGTYSLIGSGVSPTRAFRCIMMDVPNFSLSTIQAGGRANRTEKSQKNPVTWGIRFLLDGYAPEESLENKSIAGYETFKEAVEQLNRPEADVDAMDEAE